MGMDNNVNQYPPEHIRQEIDEFNNKVNEALKEYARTTIPQLIKLGKEYHRYVYCQWLYRRGMPYGLSVLISKWKPYDRVPSMGMMLGELEENK